MTLLLPIFFITVFFTFSLRKLSDFRENFLKAFLITFFLIGLSTEFLSIFKIVNFRSLTLSWILFTVCALNLLLLAWIKKPMPVGSSVDTSTTRDGFSVWFRVLSFSIILIISAITLYIAYKAPPNNFDSMTYHMARIPHWIQNQSVRYYPTAIPRQNYSMPLAEFGILQLQILSSGDHYANLIQWMSFALSIFTTSLIAKQFNVSSRGQWITAVLTATIPMAILQSSSTQNDLVVGVFCLSFAYFLNKTIRDFSWENAIFTGLSMGLALATKGTAYIYCAAIGLGIGGFALVNQKWADIKKILFKYAFIIILALILNFGIYIRNWNLYQNPIFTSNERTIVEEFSPGILISNIIRNGAVHLASPFSAANDLIDNSISSLLGSQIDNPSSTFQGSEFGISFRLNEDEAGNTLHFLLLSLSILILPFVSSENKFERWPYLITLYLSILLFSLSFKWQPWGGRLQIPIFLFGCVAIGQFIDRSVKRNFLPAALLLIIFLTSTPYLLLNSNRPVLPLWEDDSIIHETATGRFISDTINNRLGNYPALAEIANGGFSLFYEGRSVVVTERKELYFLGNFEPYYSYKGALHFVRNDPSRDIGLLMLSNQWEYPLWVQIGQHAKQGERVMYHIDVENASNEIQSEYNPKPELILVTLSDFQQIERLLEYEQVFSSDFIQIFKLSE